MTQIEVTKQNALRQETHQELNCFLIEKNLFRAKIKLVLRRLKLKPYISITTYTDKNTTLKLSKSINTGFKSQKYKHGIQKMYFCITSKFFVVVWSGACLPLVYL